MLPTVEWSAQDGGSNPQLLISNLAVAPRVRGLFLVKPQRRSTSCHSGLQCDKGPVRLSDGHNPRSGEELVGLYTRDRKDPQSVRGPLTVTCCEPARGAYDSHRRNRHVS